MSVLDEEFAVVRPTSAPGLSDGVAVAFKVFAVVTLVGAVVAVVAIQRHIHSLQSNVDVFGGDSAPDVGALRVAEVAIAISGVVEAAFFAFFGYVLQLLREIRDGVRA